MTPGRKPSAAGRSLDATLAFYRRLGFEGRILGADGAYAILDPDGSLLRIGQVIRT